LKSTEKACGFSGTGGGRSFASTPLARGIRCLSPRTFLSPDPLPLIPIDFEQKLTNLPARQIRLQTNTFNFPDIF
jgi:hypothetical protein